jgi:hypothetical protein
LYPIFLFDDDGEAQVRSLLNAAICRDYDVMSNK